MSTRPEPPTAADFVAIGLGPFNLGLACLAEPIPDLNGVFLESKPDFDWHSGMFLEGSTLQTPFLSDLVTLADPTSPFSFLNHLKETGRLYPFYIRESFYPLREEFNDYCRWAAARIPSIRFNSRVTEVTYDEAAGTYLVTTATGERWTAPRLVLGTGTPPYLPPACAGLGGDAVHSSGYLPAKQRLQAKRSITVIGSGQSAAEIYHDLLQDIDRHGYELTWATRSPRFFPLEYTKLTLEMTSPEYVDYFHALPPAVRDTLNRTQKNLYKGINSALINDIFDLLYAKSRRGKLPTRLLTNTELARAAYETPPGEPAAYVLGLRQREQGVDRTHRAEGLVLATGYRYEVPDFLGPVLHRVRRDGQGRYDVTRDYAVDVTGGGIFVQNAELHTHGFTAPDLGMAAYRNARIIRRMLGREHYRIETAIAFQEFAA